MSKNTRSTIYNKITTPEKIKNINPKNKELTQDFLDYLSSIENPVNEPIREKTILSDEQVELLLNTLVDKKNMNVRLQ